MKALDIEAQGFPPLQVISGVVVATTARQTIAHGLTLNGHGQVPQIVIPVVRSASDTDTAETAITATVDWPGVTSTNVVIKCSAACTIDIYVG